MVIESLTGYNENMGGIKEKRGAQSFWTPRFSE